MKKGVLLLLLLLVACQAEDKPIEKSVEKPAEHLLLSSTACLNQEGECRLTASQGEVRLSFADKVLPLQPFILNLDVSDWPSEVKSVLVDFKMAAMDMGKNRYSLLKNKEGYWQSRVVLPICAAGGEEWLLQLRLTDVAGNGGLATVPFRLQK
ncbi:MAG: hypothetical protein Q9N68_01770 [Gammaproteobacteria bacterium]|nr:hypothetical protein [Gammaproteobacteria bacterium]